MLCRHEQGAAMAAIGYARATGAGVRIATSGPGRNHLITGLAVRTCLYSYPVVAITGQVSDRYRHYAFQEVDVLDRR
ncbi:thiamine pyrophosphate-binding protein [Shigella flexneri]